MHTAFLRLLDKRNMQYAFPQNLGKTPQQISSHLQALEDLHYREKPQAGDVWKNWKWWVEMGPATTRPFWPQWRLTLFEDIGIDEIRFQAWYATRKDTLCECHFFDIVFEFFFDQAYDIIPSSSLKTVLYRLGMHTKAIQIYMMEEKIQKSLKSLLFFNTRDPKVLSILPLSFVYKQMLAYV